MSDPLHPALRSLPAGIQVFNKGGCSQAVSSDVIQTSEEYGNLLKVREVEGHYPTSIYRT